MSRLMTVRAVIGPMTARPRYSSSLRYEATSRSRSAQVMMMTAKTA
jgi:hypothetical protein